jgi:LysR family transcriptional regulator (chromosome initiation inhibitor)
MLEGELFEHLPMLVDPAEPKQRSTLNIATNADSLGTWFVAAASNFAKNSQYLLNIVVDDQDHTAEWLRRGRVIAAVTSLEKPVQGCKRIKLGALRYHATASPGFMSRYFAHGVTPDAIGDAPALTFNQKDRLQSRWLSQTLGGDLPHPTHWLPSTQSFVEASLFGMGWGMNPIELVRDHLQAGRLVEVVPDTPLDVAIDWQINRFAADKLDGLTREIAAVARRSLTAR